MTRSSKGVEAALAQLNALRADARAPASVDQIKKALGDRSNLIAARAADIVREAKLEALLPDAAAMCRRFMRDPAKSDPGCAAKTAAAKALYELGAGERELLLYGARFVQPEPGFGRPTDTAAELRAVCALALVRIGHPQQLEVLADHLMDPEPQVRLGAARAVGYAGSDTGTLLLRMKVRAGDAEEDVLAECFGQLLKLAPARSVEFASGFLDSRDESFRRAAAFALGASRDPAALQVLVDRWERDFSADNRLLLVPAIALHRSGGAIDFLIDRLEAVGADLAMAIVEGLSAYRHDATVRPRVERIVETRNDRTLNDAFVRHFGR